MVPAHIITLLFLFTSSLKDLRTRRGFTDKIYILSIILVAGSFLLTEGSGTAGASIIMALIGLVVGFAMNLFTKFGGADIWTLALICANFPNQLPITVIAYTFIPYIAWLKIYSLTGRKTAPAIPGLTAGLILAIAIL
ncbi:MAG: hypothetical protein ABEJ83_02945 [Candidatus Nanohaloarchaea archaeon]